MKPEYPKLLGEYPEVVTKEQLWKICHISKRKATWLLENGYIPCTDTGKQTRRFKIKMNDIIRYLEDREKHPEIYLAPPGIFTNNPAKAYRQSGQIDNFSEYRKFVENEMRDVKEVMTSAEAAEVMLSKSITERIKCKDLKVYKYKARNIITKQNLLDSYFNMLQSNRSCYREFHTMMLERYRIHQEQEKQMDEDCGDMQMMM